MRYMRTKDNRIIDTTKYYIEGSNLFKNGAYQEYKKDFANAYKVGDTIEELCDEFVILSNNYPKYLNAITKNLNWAKTANTDEVVKAVYAAIWTDKGLIYVAKMNEKGELELL